MADKIDPRTGELITPNLGLTKPTVGASVDQWGGYINGDLDLIDTAVHNVQTSVPAASTTTPAMDGTAAVGTGTTFARADHVHPIDARIIGDNRIINGDMRIDQRNNGAQTTPAATNTYVIDRWKFGGTQFSKFSFLRGTAGAGLLVNGFGYYLSAIVAAAVTPAAGDFLQAWQPIEADMIADFAWGTSSAQPVTLSFWAQSPSTTGTFSGVIGNADGTRSYPFTYTIAAVNTWYKFAVTIPGDTAGTWVLQGNGVGAGVHFDLGSGATWRAPAGAWASGNYIGANGAISLVTTASAQLSITGVKLEIGSVATPFNRQSLAKSLADCQRYYCNCVAHTVGGVTANGTGINWYYSFPVQMRAAPTINFAMTGGSGYSAPVVAPTGSVTGFGAQATGAATGYVAAVSWIAAAEL